ncbi:hypothetical protein QCA50_005563 [Cerrena zonata]|uniref:F-box domain-containing protein n=1 Tax=Cerrena zonata TaxID=2478898 RepID=A0AAW0GAR7_9APHY
MDPKKQQQLAITPSYMKVRSINQGQDHEISHPETCHGHTSGFLRDLHHMPFDILFEMFSYLKPRHLLHMSRSSKPLRSLLTSRESYLLWKTSRSNLPSLPDRPSFLSELAYASLCFDNHCRGCDSPNVSWSRINWEVLYRYCRDCSNNDGVVFLHSIETTRRFIDSLNESPVPPPYVIMGEGSHDCTSLYYHKPTLQKYMSMWNDCNSDKEREELIEKYKRYKVNISSFTPVGRKWIEQCLYGPAEAIYRFRNHRYEEICYRLTELGYGKDLTYTHMLEECPIRRLLETSKINYSRPILGQTWVNISNTILPLIEQIRTDRLLTERTNTIYTRIRHLQLLLATWNKSVGFVTPSTRELLFIPEVASLIGAPQNQCISQEDLCQLEGVIYKFSQEWKQEQLALYTRIISASLMLSPNTNITSLAASHYSKCPRCSAVVSFPNALVHRCRCLAKPNRATDVYENVIGRLKGLDAISTLEHLTVLDDLQVIIEACGEDPTTVTTCAMDALDVRLECRVCRKDGFCDVYNWRRALQHAQRLHDPQWNSSIRAASWCQVDSTYFPIIKRLESKWQSDHLSSHEDVWVCTHCPSSTEYDDWNNQWHGSIRNTRARIIQHLTKEHNIENPGDGDLYQSPWRGSKITPGYVSLIFKGTKIGCNHEFQLSVGEAEVVDPPYNANDL